MALLALSFFLISCVETNATYSPVRQSFSDAYARVAQNVLSVGETTYLTVYPSRDSIGDGVKQFLRRSDVKVSTSISSTASVVGIGPGLEQEDGSLRFLITGQSIGNEIYFNISIRGTNLTSLAPRIRVTPSDYSLTLSTVSVSAPTVAAGTYVKATVRTRNTSGVALTTGGLIVRCNAQAAGQDVQISPVIDNGDGTYETDILATTASAPTVISCSINNQSMSTGASFATTAGSTSVLVLTTIAGENVVGTTVRTFTVEAKDAYGNPSAGLGLTWDTESGGSFSAGTVTTDANGTATTDYTMGPQAGFQYVSVHVTDAPSVSSNISVLVKHGPPVSLEKVFGEPSPTPLRQAVEDPITVRVLDAFGNVVQGAQVNWSTTTVNGAVFDPATGNSNVDGLVSAAVTMGEVPGAITLRASLDADPTQRVDYYIEAVLDPPVIILVTQGASPMQEARAGRVLATDLKIVVQDQYGNPVPNIEISWEELTGGATAFDRDNVTDEDGEATSKIRLGVYSGFQSIRIRTSNGVTRDVSFRATVGDATKFVIEGGNLQQALIYEEAEPLRVFVGSSLAGDDLDIPVPNVDVVWSIVAGGAAVPGSSISTQLSKTDIEGVAQTYLTLGEIVGQIQVRAETPDYPAFDPVTFTITSVYDVSAELYFDRIGAAMVSDDNKRLVHQFIRGLKAEDLYSDINEMWFMARKFNTNTGCVIPAFKSNLRNAVIHNAAGGNCAGGDADEGWRADGLYSKGAGANPIYAVASNTQKTADYNQRTIMVVVSRTAAVDSGFTPSETYAQTSARDFDYSAPGDASGRGFKLGRFVQWGNSKDDWGQSDLNGAGLIDLVMTITSVYGGGNILSYVNGKNPASASMTTSEPLRDSHNIHFMKQPVDSNNHGLHGRMLFAMDYKKSITTQKVQTIHELFRTTLGVGESIP